MRQKSPAVPGVERHQVSRAAPPMEARRRLMIRSIFTWRRPSRRGRSGVLVAIIAAEMKFGDTIRRD